jgi:hypothetical protein
MSVKTFGTQARPHRSPPRKISTSPSVSDIPASDGTPSPPTSPRLSSPLFFFPLLTLLSLPTTIHYATGVDMESKPNLILSLDEHKTSEIKKENSSNYTKRELIDSTNTNSNNNSNNNGSSNMETMSLTGSIQGVGRAVLRSSYKPPDVRTLMRSMETAAKYGEGRG